MLTVFPLGMGEGYFYGLYIYIYKRLKINFLFRKSQTYSLAALSGC